MPKLIKRKMPVRNEWIAGLWRASGLSKRKFAKLIGLDPSSFGSMSTGDRAVSDRTVYRIIAVLKVPPPSGMPAPPEHAKKEDLEALRKEQLRLTFRLQELETTLRESRELSQDRRKNKEKANG